MPALIMTNHTREVPSRERPNGLQEYGDDRPRITGVGPTRIHTFNAPRLVWLRTQTISTPSS